VSNKLFVTFLFHLGLQKESYLHSDRSNIVKFLKDGNGKLAHLAPHTNITFYFSVLSKV
jgi:hypothetical protein